MFASSANEGRSFIKSRKKLVPIWTLVVQPAHNAPCPTENKWTSAPRTLSFSKLTLFIPRSQDFIQRFQYGQAKEILVGKSTNRVQIFLQKPCCSGANIELLVRRSTNRVQIILSYTLDRTDIIEIVLLRFRITCETFLIERNNFYKFNRELIPSDGGRYKAMYWYQSIADNSLFWNFVYRYFL